MRRRTFLARVVTGVAAAAATTPARAQEGHPLTGTWSGDWGPAGAPRTRVTLVIGWEGNELSGVINPGPNAIPVRRIALDPGTWQVRLEAESIVADGRLDDLGSYRRRLAGTWTQGATSGTFRLTRD